MSKLPSLAAVLFGNRTKLKSNDNPQLPTSLSLPTPILHQSPKRPRIEEKLELTIDDSSNNAQRNYDLISRRKKLPPLAAQLFTNNGPFCLPVGSPKKNLLVPVNCKSACSQGCREPEPEILAEDVESDDDFEMFDATALDGDTDAGDNDNSSIEDAIDAFEDMDESQSSLQPSVLLNKGERETDEKEKKTRRQKGDAESLKKFAFG